MLSFYFVFFFFKQKTAYEMRISDWSSDVCSSDLTVNTQQALGQLELLTREREEAEAAREKLGLPPATFALYWHLQGEALNEPLVATREIMAAADRYPNHADNDDERRKLKAEIYRILLLQKIEGGRMVALGEALLRSLGRDRPA